MKTTDAPSELSHRLDTTGGAGHHRPCPTHHTVDQGEPVTPRKTEAEARAALAAMEPIMAIEGRDMSDGDKELLVELIQGTKTLEDVTKIIARDAGYEID